MAQNSGKLRVVRHEFAGGWATDFGISDGAGIEANSPTLVRYRYLLEATNAQYDLDGSPRRMGGATKLNPTVIDSGSAVRGVFDFWKQGPSASPVQKRVLHAGTQVFQDDADGVFSSLITGLTADKIPSYSQLDDKVFIASDGNADADAPRSWDQSTVRVMQAPHTVVKSVGTGLNDASTTGTFTGTSDIVTVVEITTAAGTDQITWTGGLSGGPENITASNDLGSGVNIVFDATTGHTLNDKWTITTHLAPNFSISEPHKERLFVAGVAVQGSRVFYSTRIDAGGPEDFVNGGSGFIDILPDNGDSITGLVSHQDALFVFKGPHKGSIHRITGSSPKGTGSDGFALRTFVGKGLGAAGHNSIFHFRDDVGFQWSDGSIHSLSTVAAHGDFKQAALSLPLNLKFLARRVNHDRLATAWAATDSALGVVAITVPIDGSSVPNFTIVMDYRFDPVRWSNWPAYDAESIARVLDSSGTNLPILMGGGSDGFVRKLNQDSNVIEDGASIAFEVRTPVIDYGLPDHIKTLSVISLACEPVGDFTPTFTWFPDSKPSDMQDMDIISSGDRLTPVSAGRKSFVLDASRMAGAAFVQKTESIDGGTFQAISYAWTDDENSVAVSIRNFRTTIHQDEISRGGT